MLLGSRGELLLALEMIICVVCPSAVGRKVDCDGKWLENMGCFKALRHHVIKDDMNKEEVRFWGS